jgi:hypothetical protein
MSTMMKTRRSRRAVLAAAAGAAAATVVAAIDHPVPALAGADGDVVLGGSNTAATTTSIAGTTAGIRVLKVDGVTGPEATDLFSGVAIHGTVVRSGAADDHLGVAVLGEAEDFCTGVDGRSDTGHGVFGQSESGIGIHGGSHSGTGVDGFSDEGTGVSAASTQGTAASAESQHGTALKAYGKVQLFRSGRAWVRAGSRTVTVDLTSRSGLGGTPLCFANLMSYRSGVWVTVVRPNYPAAGRLRIYLNKAVTSRTSIAWLVLDDLPGPAPWDL